MYRGSLILVLGLVFGAAACKGSPGPSPVVAIQLSATPNPVAGALCGDCGAGSTDREVATTVAIQETGGAAATVLTIAMTLNETGSNTVIASGEFNTAAVQQLAGSSRVPANGRLNVRVGVHYPPAQAGKAATFSITVRVRDDRGTEASQTMTVPVTST